MKTAKEILAIKEPELIYTNDPFTAEKELKEFKIAWHPDKNKDPLAVEVLQHLTDLHNKAIEKMKIGIWSVPGTLQLRDRITAQVYEIKYVKEHKFELGIMYMGKSTVTFLIENNYRDLYESAIKQIKGFKYKSPDMQKEVSRYLPSIKKQFETTTHCVLAVDKTPDLILLRDVYEKLGNLDPKHVAWIMSSLYNLTCYFKVSKLTHNNISLDTYFISPQYHSGVLLGGWWYNSPVDSVMKALPEKTLNCVPSDILVSKKSNARIDLELIRGLGRELLTGDINKISLLRKSGAPKPLIDWLAFGSIGNAIEEYAKWQTCLKDSFGPRKFIKMNLPFEVVYNV